MLRMTRRLDSGIVKVKDRKKDKDGKFETVFHVLGAKHSPKMAMIQNEKEVDDKANPGKKKKEKIKDSFRPDNNADGTQKISKHGETFEVFDEDHVLKNHSGIFEKC